MIHKTHKLSCGAEGCMPAMGSCTSCALNKGTSPPPETPRDEGCV